MVIEECFFNCAGMNSEPPLMVPDIKTEAIDGFRCVIGTNGLEGGSSGESLQTYKRRKRGKADPVSTVRENGTVCTDNPSADPVGNNMNGSKFNSFLKISNCESGGKSMDDPRRHFRSLVLENIYQSVCESEGGIRDCIREALKVDAQIECPTSMKTHINKVGHVNLSKTEVMCNGSQNVAERISNLTSNGSLNELNHQNTSDLCQRVFSSLISSENFAALCKLLLENFQGIQVKSFVDFSLINTRMAAGAYENFPDYFLSDIQQVLRKLKNIGTEMVSLVDSLSDMATSSCIEKVSTEASDCKTEDRDTSNNICTCCHQCGEKAKDKDCLVCDSCEVMYHLSCIKPTIDSIPPKTWFCPKCNISGFGSPHENCVVCLSRNPQNPVNNEISKESCICLVCRCETENHEERRVCGHQFCNSKYYHVRCLSPKQLKSYGPCWYCPSCICTVCFNNQDDDKIVICDGCDHAYHTYCMDPPCTVIPEGKWFCKKCNIGIQEIRKKRMVYEILEKQENEEAKDGLKKKFKNCDF